MPATPSWPGIAVRRTASLRSPMSRPSTSCLLTIQQDVDARHKAGHDESAFLSPSLLAIRYSSFASGYAIRWPPFGRTKGHGDMDLGLTGKVALVTGSSRGIGRGIALTLATEGCDVVLTGRREAAVRGGVAAVEKLGRKARFETIDLRKDEAPAALVGAVQRGFGRLDILVNNAGTTKRGDFLELTDADWQDGYALKFFAHVRLARAAWPLLQSNGGSIVTIGGTSGGGPPARPPLR